MARPFLQLRPVRAIFVRDQKPARKAFSFGVPYIILLPYRGIGCLSMNPGSHCAMLLEAESRHFETAESVRRACLRAPPLKCRIKR